jgi:hypothetical protein
MRSTGEENELDAQEPGRQAINDYQAWRLRYLRRARGTKPPLIPGQRTPRQETGS